MAIDLQLALAIERVAAGARAVLDHLPDSVDMDVLASVEAAARLVDVARVRAAAPLAGDLLAAERLGFASPVAAVAAVARVTERTARERLTIAAAVSPQLSISGSRLAPAHPSVGEALDAGTVGMDAATLIIKELDSVAPRVEPDALSAAETLMVNLASCLDPSGQTPVAPVSVTYLTTEIRQIGAAVDPDGARPREQRAIRARGFRVGKPDEDGLCPASGRLLPEVAATFLGLAEAARRSPKFIDSSATMLDEAWNNGDSRTPDQRRHDILAELLIAAAASPGSPRLDGQPVTVVVTVTAEDLERADGLAGDPIGTMSGSPVPVSRATVERFIDSGGYRTVALERAGAIAAIGSPERCFRPAQRLAIATRDGYRCATPGCTSPHYALQVHHVMPWRDSGLTSVDNGILLCYWHHRRVDDGPWQYRIVDGLPEVRGPGLPEWTRLRGLVTLAA